MINPYQSPQSTPDPMVWRALRRLVNGETVAGWSSGIGAAVAMYHMGRSYVQPDGLQFILACTLLVVSLTVAVGLNRRYRRQDRVPQEPTAVENESEPRR